MKVIRQKIFFEKTKEMEETAENWNKAKKKIKSISSNIYNKAKHPKELGEYLKDKSRKLKEKVSDYKENPDKLKEDSKSLGKKAIKFVKDNPRDAVYIGSSYFVIPPVVNKVVSKYKGSAAGKVAAGVAAGLPIGEALIGADHFVRSDSGKTAIKAGGQVVKGVASDIKNKLTGKSNKKK